ncbi:MULTISPECIES: hypothetical protein [unclassified Rhodococcus (in: high G+C Gram-positive bacteria)]|uniref:hypothetical protein n=1 Tax=unclassified Rhodococcus (in: high G+C Gram-positive bacteria) TaxID=192944 RepID=UPI000B9A4F4E|nr:MULTISPECIES: hypothetical protein [unclassified Rhodococcus (in: high G+C Gram-positive bacteria)]OZE35657.1 hypothetical protein CH259_16670 [Rhodococcus sp. 05-2254-4]OZE48086.1 hypothetical protein CH261_09265 [Rhodococcus sp. 05-2254-3]OZE49297.1 hypothetical protein CH283_17050 [Rhodococcus sp. 05-2254-2]
MNALVPIEHFTMWLATGERGISSEKIASHLSGVPITKWSQFDSHPHDPSDFRRCERLFRAVPLARLHMSAVGDISPVWRNLVDHWDEIVALCEQDWPGCIDNSPSRTAGAPNAYRRMKELIEEARAAA